MAGGLNQELSKIIATLAEVLDVEGDAETARLLRQSEFELQETGYDNWNGGTYTYALVFSVSARRFAEIGDKLSSLENRLLARFEQMTRAYTNEYLGSVIVTPSLDVPDARVGHSPAEPRFWAAGEFKLFISHVSAEKVLASQISASMRIYGVSCFVAHEDIEPTKEWVDEIILALNTMDACLALLTPGFSESKWTGQEVGVAVGRGSLVVPVKMGLDPYGFIGRYQALPGLGKAAPAIAHEAVGVLARASSHKTQDGPRTCGRL